MINCESIENLIEAARAMVAQHPEALSLLQGALQEIDADEQDTASNAQAIDIARDDYVVESEGDIQIDDEPLVCMTDEGVWVNAWVWVPESELVG